MTFGLVLGAGGATGHAFHCGVLAALADEVGLDATEAELIVGTSAGAAVGALVRAGLDGRDLAARATGRPLSSRGQAIAARAGGPVTTYPPPPAPSGRQPLSPQGAMALMSQPWRARLGVLGATLLPAGRESTEPMAAPFRRLFADRWPQARLWICAVDVDRGTRMVFKSEVFKSGAAGRGVATSGVAGSGAAGNRGAGGDPAGSGGNPAGLDRLDLATAVAASCAIPGWFAPVEIGGARYVDGGVWSPTNADVVASEGLDLLVVSAPLSGRSAPAGGRSEGERGGGVDQAMRLVHQFYGRAEALWVQSRLQARDGTGWGAPTRVVMIEPTAEDLAVMGRNPMDGTRRTAVVDHVRRTMTARLSTGDLSRAFPP